MAPVEDCRRYEAQTQARFRELAEQRSADPETQSRIVREVWKLFYAFARHASVSPPGARPQSRGDVERNHPNHGGNRCGYPQVAD